jgi:CRP-like cAMP-binding protein
MHTPSSLFQVKSSQDKQVTMPETSVRNPDAPRLVAGVQVKNLLLQAIPDNEFKHLQSRLEPVQFAARKILHEAGDTLESAYFLNSGLASLVVVTSDARSVEIGVTGREGVLGTPLSGGLRRLPYRAIIQVAGDGLRIHADALKDTLPWTPDLAGRLNRASMLQSMLVAQIAACNRLHEVEQRLARWLLMAQDRVGSDMLPLTHDVLAQLLGTGRPSISLAVGLLERVQTIQNMRGKIRILNRNRLSETACECYSILQNYRDRDAV